MFLRKSKSCPDVPVPVGGREPPRNTAGRLRGGSPPGSEGSKESSQVTQATASTGVREMIVVAEPFDSIWFGATGVPKPYAQMLYLLGTSLAPNHINLDGSGTSIASSPMIS